MKLQVSSIILVFFVTMVTAPFPEDHPYHFLNPFIEPWWERLSKSQQKVIYSYWERAEPAAFKAADAAEKKWKAIQLLIDTTRKRGHETGQVIHGVSKETLGALKILLREAYKSKKEALRGAMKYLRDTSVVTAVKDVYKVVTDG